MHQARRLSLKSVNESTPQKVTFKENEETNIVPTTPTPYQNGSSISKSSQLLSRRNSVLSCPPGQIAVSRTVSSYPQKRRLSLPTLGTEHSSFNHRCQPIVNKNKKPQQKYSEINASGEVKPLLPLLITTGPSSSRPGTGNTSTHPGDRSDTRSFCDSISTIPCSNISSTSSDEHAGYSTIIPLSSSAYRGKTGRTQVEDWLTMMKTQK